MNWIIILAAACGIAVVQGLFLGTTLLLKGKNSNSPDFFLGLAIISLAIRIGKSLVYYFWMDMSLWGVAFGGAGLFAAGPALMLYVQSENLRSISKIKYLHFLPSVLILFSGSLLGWPEMQVLYVLGTVQLFIYIGISLFIHLKSSAANNKFVLAMIIGISVVTSSFAFQLSVNAIEYYALGGVIAAIILYILNFAVIKGGRNSKRKTTTSINKEKMEILNEVMLAVQKVIIEDKFYKEPKLTLNKLADKIDRPSYLVRQAIAQNEGLSFNDYINIYRITEVKKVLGDKYSPYTIEGMAYDVGFTSISSFYEAFKKVVNCTPVEYKKTILTQ